MNEFSSHTVRIQEEIVYCLRKIIVEERLYKDKVSPSKLVAIELKKWLDNPVLDVTIIINKKWYLLPRKERVVIKLDKETTIKLYEVYSQKYIDYCNSISTMIYNFILQFLNDRGFNIFEELNIDLSRIGD